MSAKGLGIMMIFMGIGSFLLPLAGLQFRILTIFGKSQWIIGLVLIIIGSLLMFAKEGAKQF